MQLCYEENNKEGRFLVGMFRVNHNIPTDILVGSIS